MSKIEKFYLKISKKNPGEVVQYCFENFEYFEFWQNLQNFDDLKNFSIFPEISNHKFPNQWKFFTLHKIFERSRGTIFLSKT